MSTGAALSPESKHRPPVAFVTPPPAKVSSSLLPAAPKKKTGVVAKNQKKPKWVLIASVGPFASFHAVSFSQFMTNEYGYVCVESSGPRMMFVESNQSDAKEASDKSFERFRDHVMEFKNGGYLKYPFSSAFGDAGVLDDQMAAQAPAAPLVFRILRCRDPGLGIVLNFPEDGHKGSSRAPTIEFSHQIAVDEYQKKKKKNKTKHS